MKNLYRLLSTMFSIPVFVMVFFIISGIHSIYANDNIVDLEKSVSDMHNDTAKVNVLLTLGEHYCSIENDKALMYLQEAFTISTSKNYTIGIGKSLLWQGRVYYYKDDYPLAVKYLDKAKKVLETTDELNTLAFIYFAKAEISRIRGDFIHALEMYREAINLTEKTGNTKFRALYYSGIGRVLLDRKDTEKALGYFMETLNIQKTIGDQQGMSNTLTCIGISYEELGELDSSLTYHNLALKIRTDLKMYRLIASSEYHKSGVLIKMGKYVQAEKSLQIALKNFIKLEEKTGIIITSLRLAVARNRQEKPNAIESAEKALLMAKNIKNPNLISHAYKILSDIYFFNNNYKESYIYLEKHKALQDSLFSTEKERILAEIEEKYQSELKDNKIALLKEKSRIQENNNLLLIVLSMVLLMIIILLIFLFRYKSTAFKRKQKLLEQENIIHTQEKQIAEKGNLILQEQLESKNREMASKALEMLRFNETISSIIDKLEGLNISMKKSPEMVRHIKKIIHDLEDQTKQNIWIEFEKIFKNIHSGFYGKLLEICPELTATEIKTAALLKLNLTTKEIAAITFKSEGGIKTTRYRLRKKLNFTSDDKLVPFLMQI